jgi:hypothetical protein
MLVLLGHFEMLEWILSSDKPYDINAQDKNGKTSTSFIFFEYV